MKKISILMLHLQHGGIEKQTISFANQLSKYHDVEIISFYSMNAEPSYAVDPAVKLRYLYDGAPNRDEIKAAIKGKNPLAIFKEGLKAVKILYLKKRLMIKEIKALKCDYVLSTRIEYAEMLSRYAPKGVVTMTQEHLHNDSEKYIRRLKKAFAGLDYLIVLCKSSKENYSRWLADNEKIKIVEIPNILDSIPENSAKLHGMKLVSVGRLHPVKNFKTLIDVFSLVHNELPEASLSIVGGGDEYSELKARAAECGLDDCVSFTGMVSSPEVMAQLISSDIYVMTSHTECFPMVLLEAASAGLPLIAFDVPVGPASIIKDGENGFLIEYANKQQMADKIISMLKEREILNATAQKAKDFSFNYTAEAIIPLWLDIFGV